MKRTTITVTLVFLVSIAALHHVVRAANFGDDTAFLKKYTELIVLSDSAGVGKVALAPAWQGRVMTSTAGGDAGLSFGWINRELIASKKILPHINVFGGEDRFWLGPEGGQFSIFFAKGAKFELADWQTPAVIDTEPFKVVSKSSDRAVFAAKFPLTNYSGTRFEVAVNREVRLLDSDTAWQATGCAAGQGCEPRRLRIGQPDHERGPERLEEGNRTALGLDSRDVQSIAIGHDRRTDSRRSGSRTGCQGDFGLLRQHSAGAVGGERRRDLLRRGW